MGITSWRSRRAIRSGDEARDRRAWDDARDAYAEALRLDPSLSHIWVQYGHALKELQRLDDAEAAYRQALVSELAIADTHLQLGHVLKLQGKTDAAANEYQRATEIDPGSVDAAGELAHLRPKANVGGVLALESVTVPEGIRLSVLNDNDKSYSLALSTGTSSFEEGVERLGVPDLNAKLLCGLLRGSGTLIDVGANIGTIAVPVAVSGSKVVAIELLPTNCLRLWTAASANQLDNLHVIHAAAGDYDGLISYEGSEAWGHVTAEKGSQTAVCLRLDTIVSSVPYALDTNNFAIKIDVEGHEEAVLRGADGVLRHLRPYVLFESIEIEGETNQTTPTRRTRQFVRERNYDLFLKCGNVLAPRDPDDLQEGCVCDFLAVPREKTAQLAVDGFEFRELTPAERVDWLVLMASFGVPHQRHAAGVVLRWARENPDLARQAKPVAVKLLEFEHLADLHDLLRACAD